ncbi:MAG TPA: hypothetical protein DDY98_08085 [Ruminococcaceae bacterium]|nr:hypothetical protein [Oscillospiraceae bacterium]
MNPKNPMEKIRSIVLLFVFLAAVVAERILSAETSLCISCGVVFLLSLFYIRFRRIEAATLGTNLPVLDRLFDFFHMGVDSAIAVAAVLGIEALVWRLFLGDGRLFHFGTDVVFYHEDYSFVNGGLKNCVIFLLFGGFCAMVRAVSQELFFRGIFFAHCQKVSNSPAAANVRQALGYSLFFVVATGTDLVKNIVEHAGGEKTGWSIVALLCAFLYGFVSGLRQGLVRTATGSLYAAVFSHFFLDWFYLVFNSSGVFQTPNETLSFLLQMLCVQLVAFLPLFVRIRKAKKTQQNADS